MKLMLIGAGGQLGRELQYSLRALGDVVLTDRSNLDVQNVAKLRDAVRAIKPQVIVNAAAYTAVDLAETDIANATKVNTNAPDVMSAEAKQLGAMLIHYSTDYVFDGSKATPYTEDDITAPLSVYGRTKREGEQAILASGCRHLILRTSWLYGLDGSNFMTTMLKLARERDQLRIVGDQIGAPTWTHHLADATALILGRPDFPSGLYHAAAAGETSWFSYAEASFAEALRLGLLPKAPRLERITSAQYPLPANRPKNSRLDCSRLQRDFDLRLPDWREGLTDCLADKKHSTF